jgi:hypothetical protein
MYPPACRANRSSVKIMTYPGPFELRIPLFLDFKVAGHWYVSCYVVAMVVREICKIKIRIERYASEQGKR